MPFCTKKALETPAIEAWKGFFSVLADAGYTGAMNIENEDEFYYPAYAQGNFTEQYKRGFRTAHEFLKTMVPPVSAG